MTGYSIGTINFKREGKVKPFRIYDALSCFFNDSRSDTQEILDELKKDNKYIIREEGLTVTDKKFSAFGIEKCGTIEDRIRRGKGVVDGINLVEYDGMIISNFNIVGVFPYLKGVEFELSPEIRRPLHLSCEMTARSIYEFICRLVMVKNKKKLEGKVGGTEFVLR